jgi:CheY-like chemotaxis protein
VAGVPLLVIESNPANRVFLQRVLAGAGYRLLLADNAETGAALLRRPEYQPVRHIILSVDDPMRDAVRDLFTIFQAPNHRTIILAAPRRLCPALSRALEVRETAIIPKPFDPDAVLRIVHEHVSGLKHGVPH